MDEVKKSTAKKLSRKLENGETARKLSFCLFRIQRKMKQPQNLLGPMPTNKLLIWLKKFFLQTDANEELCRKSLVFSSLRSENLSSFRPSRKTIRWKLKNKERKLFRFFVGRFAVSKTSRKTENKWQINNNQTESLDVSSSLKLFVFCDSKRWETSRS